MACILIMKHLPQPVTYILSLSDPLLVACSLIVFRDSQYGSKICIGRSYRI